MQLFKLIFIITFIHSTTWFVGDGYPHTTLTTLFPSGGGTPVQCGDHVSIENPILISSTIYIKEMYCTGQDPVIIGGYDYKIIISEDFSEDYVFRIEDGGVTFMNFDTGDGKMVFEIRNPLYSDTTTLFYVENSDVTMGPFDIHMVNTKSYRALFDIAMDTEFNDFFQRNTINNVYVYGDFEDVYHSILFITSTDIANSLINGVYSTVNYQNLMNFPSAFNVSITNNIFKQKKNMSNLITIASTTDDDRGNVIFTNNIFDSEEGIYGYLFKFYLTDGKLSSIQITQNFFLNLGDDAYIVIIDNTDFSYRIFYIYIDSNIFIYMNPYSVSYLAYADDSSSVTSLCYFTRNYINLDFTSIDFSSHSSPELGFLGVDSTYEIMGDVNEFLREEHFSYFFLYLHYHKMNNVLEMYPRCYLENYIYDPFGHCEDCLGNNWDSESLCLECKSGYDKNDECQSCINFYDQNDECQSCINFYDIDSNCTKCLQNYNITTHCASCNMNYDHSTKCSSCIGNWDIDEGCEKCKDGYDIDFGCNNCLLNFDQNDACQSCINSFDIDLNCTKCLPNYNITTQCISCNMNYDHSTKCSSCIGNWDLEEECEECKEGYDISYFCNRCLPNYDYDSNCLLCKGNYDITSECVDCLPNYDILTNCTSCIGTYDMKKKCKVKMSKSDSNNAESSEIVTSSIVSSLISCVVLVILIAVILVLILLFFQKTGINIKLEKKTKPDQDISLPDTKIPQQDVSSTTNKK